MRIATLFLFFVFIFCANPQAFGNGPSSTYDSLNALFDQHDYESMLPLCKELTSNKDRKTQADGYYWKGLALSEMDEFEAALRAYYTSLERYKEFQDDDNIAMVYGQIAVVYYDAGDLKRAESFMIRSIKLFQKNPEGADNTLIAEKYFNLGNIFLTEYSKSEIASDKEKSLTYFNKAEALCKELSPGKNEFLIQMIAANRSIIYSISYDPEFIYEYPPALAYFISIHDSNQVALLYSAQTYYAMHEEDYSKALAFSDSSLSNFPLTGQSTILSDFYAVRSKVFEKLGNAPQALYYRKLTDSLEHVLKDPETIGNMHAISKKAEKSDIQKKHSKTLDNLEMWMNGVLFLLIVGAIALIIVIRRRKKLKQELKLLAEENRRFEIELAQYSKGETMVNDHSSYAYLIDETTQLISKHSEFEPQAQRIQKIGFPFVVALKKHYPDFTKNDVRLCFLLIVGMRSKEIAALLHIEPASVDRQRYRLRKKMDLKSGENLTVLLENIIGQRPHTQSNL